MRSYQNMLIFGIGQDNCDVIKLKYINWIVIWLRIKIGKWTWSSQLNEQLKRLKKNLKNSGLTGNRILTFAMTRHNALFIRLIKSTGEQAIVSSSLSRDINFDCKKKHVCL